MTVEMAGYAALLFGLNIITPGVSFLLTVQHSLAYGEKVGYGVAVGLSIADIVLAFFVSIGFATALQANGVAMTILGYAGGVWIASIGLTMIQRSRRAQFIGPMPEDTTIASMNFIQGMKVGVITGMSNPQTILFYASIFIGFLANQDTAAQIVPIFGVVVVTSVLLRSGIAGLVSLHAVRTVYLAKKTLIESLSGAALSFLGTKMAASALLPLSLKLVAMTTLAAAA